MKKFKLTPLRALWILACLSWVPFIVIVSNSGCASPPTQMETKVFEVVTNVVQVIKTNSMTLTNVEVRTVTVTNAENIVTKTEVTNFTAVPIYFTITNTVERWDYVQGTNAAEIKAVARSIGGAAGGPLGEVIAGFIATAGLGLWGWLRQTAKSKLAVNSMQTIETCREFIKSLPGGAEYDQELVKWMVKHQQEAGVLSATISTLATMIDNRDAKEAAASVIGAINALSKPPPITTSPTPTTPPPAA